MFIWNTQKWSLHGSPHPPEWAHHGIVGAPVTTSPVLSRAQEKLASPVVRVLIEDPVTLHDIAGVHVTVMEAVIHVGAVIHELHCVPHHLRPVVDPHPVGSSVLCVKVIGTWHNYYAILVGVNSREHFSRAFCPELICLTLNSSDYLVSLSIDENEQQLFQSMTGFDFFPP